MNLFHIETGGREHPFYFSSVTQKQITTDMLITTLNCAWTVRAIRVVKKSTDDAECKTGKSTLNIVAQNRGTIECSWFWLDHCTCDRGQRSYRTKTIWSMFACLQTNRSWFTPTSRLSEIGTSRCVTSERDRERESRKYQGKENIKQVGLRGRTPWRQTKIQRNNYQHAATIMNRRVSECGLK